MAGNMRPQRADTPGHVWPWPATVRYREPFPRRALLAGKAVRSRSASVPFFIVDRPLIHAEQLTARLAPAEQLRSAADRVAGHGRPYP